MSLSWYYLRRPPLELHFVDSGAFDGYKLNLNNEFYMNSTRIGELFPYAGILLTYLFTSYFLPCSLTRLFTQVILLRV